MPLEWATIDDIPIGFLFDVCRLPSNTTRLLSSFAYNNNCIYVVNENTFNKHLLLSSSDDNIQKYSPSKSSDILEIEINQSVCSSIKEVQIAIEKNHPELLIFDCHGGFDPKESSSYLCFGKEKLTYTEIISRNLSAPLVILSCCNTSPLASFNSIGDAFLCAGAFAVLVTSHPIGLLTGSVLVTRILKNLQFAVNHCVHSNWLNFISHALRTSIHHQYLEELAQRTGVPQKPMSSVILENKDDPRVVWKTKTMLFTERMQCYRDLSKYIVECFPESKRELIEDAVRKTPLPLEYLYYSNLGRPDLVFFQNYLESELRVPEEVLRD